MSIDGSPKEIIKRRILKRVKDIPSLPQFVILTLKKIDDERSSASDVAKSLSKDQGLVVRVYAWQILLTTASQEPLRA